MDSAQRTTIIAAAAVAAGPFIEGDEGWTQRVNELAAQLAAMCSDRSPTGRLLEAIEQAKVFTAVIAGGRVEQSSTRFVVDLVTSPNEHHPDGIEPARTERTDSPAGDAMARRLWALRGHRVLLWVELEPMRGSNRSVRVVRHVEDLGMPQEPQAPPPAQASGTAGQ